MNKIRVNKITVNVDKQNDITTISLYKTNQLLGTIKCEDIDVPPYSLSGISVKGYQAYCKDIIINLLENDGIDGFYYRPKEEHDSIKYDMSKFRGGVKEYIISLIGDDNEIYMTQNDEIINNEKYTDHFIKNAMVKFNIKIADHSIYVLSEIKSGQMCRPRLIYYNNKEYSFNTTNFRKIIMDKLD